MEPTNYPSPSTGHVIHGPDTASSVRNFLANVFSYMTLALVISGVMAWWFASTPELLAYLYNVDAEGYITGRSILGWVVMLAPLGLVFAMGGLVNRMSGAVLLLTFIAFSAIMGISLCYVFIAYSPAAIIKVFLMTSGVFAIMAIAGYTTKTDLTKLGSLLFIGLIGIVLASLANMLIGSSTMDYVISIIGVVVFTGLTAYDVQRLKAMGEQVAVGSDGARKMALMGSLSLYLNFINLFLMLLRLFGGGRD
ncbi:MAG: Bax inhibitor-1/YccA family protein [Flavobacteriales bacterium]|nr:Bax inhibitor-1/YccA family protein [Flavobacteriales bacterium]MCB0780505.1 Bax inhibitor-1/YccA family protein [Flavobacteriales bacterium]